MRPTLILDIPAPDKPGPNSFNTQPEAVRRWLAALPLGHVGESTRQIYGALYQVNRLDIDVHQRLDFLEQVGVPLDGLLRTLKRHFSDKPFPPDEKATRVSLLATELLTAMVIGYQAVMQQSDARHWFRQRKWERLWTTALQRMMHYLSAILCNYRALQLPEPPGIWLRVHRGYRLAADNGLLDIVVPGVADPERTTTTDDEYKRLLLLAMATPQRLRSDQLAEIGDSMSLWTAGMELFAPASPADCEGRYCVDVDEDTPPLPLWKLHAGRQPALGTIRALRMDELLEELQGQLRQHRIDPALCLADGRTIRRETLAALVDGLRRPPERGDAREADGGDVHAVFGLREIHLLVSQLQAPPAPPAPAPVAPPAESAAPEVARDRFELEGKVPGDARAAHWGFTAQRDEETDVWDMVYAGRVSETAPSWNEVEVSKSYRMRQGTVIDRSRGGVGLSFVTEDVGQIKDGDLVAFNATADVTEWHIGCVRWLRMKPAGRLEIGIKRLQQRVVPATVRTEQQGRRSAPIECLLGPEEEQLRIVLPQMNGLGHKRLLLESGGREAHIVLLEQLEGSPTYRMFRFVEKQEAEADADKARREEEAKKDEFDRFRSLWDVL